MRIDVCLGNIPRRDKMKRKYLIGGLLALVAIVTLTLVSAHGFGKLGYSHGWKYGESNQYHEQLYEILQTRLIDFKTFLNNIAVFLKLGKL